MTCRHIRISFTMHSRTGSGAEDDQRQGSPALQGIRQDLLLLSLLAMVFGFLGGELRALTADALTSSVLPPRSAAQGPWMPESSPPQKLAILRAHDRRARALSPAPLYSLRECGGAPLSPLPSLALAHPIDPPIAVVARISLTAHYTHLSSSFTMPCRPPPKRTTMRENATCNA